MTPTPDPVALLLALPRHGDAQAAAIAAAVAEVRRLRDAIRAHRDQQGDDRCWLDDLRLYDVLGEPSSDGTLPPKCEFLKSCERYWEQRQSPDEKRQSACSRMTIGQLEAEVRRLRVEWDAVLSACVRPARRVTLLMDPTRLEEVEEPGWAHRLCPDIFATREEAVASFRKAAGLDPGVPR